MEEQESFDSPIPAIPVPASAIPAPRAKKVAPIGAKKVRIIIDEGGLQDLTFVFVGLNGQTYKIERGEEVVIPVEVQEVLDHALTTVMVRDRSGRSTPRRSLRFPYRVIGEVA